MALIGLWQDERVQRFLGGAIPEEAAAERFARVLGHWDDHGYGLCLVRETASDRRAGLCGLARLEEEVELAYKLDPEFWGQGYATEAGAACVNYGFDTLRLARIVGLTQESNLTSRRVLEKLGMRHEKTVSLWNAPQRLYALERPAWEETFAARAGGQRSRRGPER